MINDKIQIIYALEAIFMATYLLIKKPNDENFFSANRNNNNHNNKLFAN